MTKKIAVVGGGVVGVCTAFFLAEAGHQVIVLERHHNVAEEASFANGGVISPGFVTPWTVSDFPKSLFSRLLKSTGPVFIKPKLDRPLKRWLARWLAENELERYRANTRRIQRVAYYSREILQQMREYFQLEYEQTQGVLHLFRTEQDVNLSAPVRELLAEQGIPHEMLTPDAARQIEPALGYRAELAGALYMPQDETGNCPLFAKQMRHYAQSIGVEFRFTNTVQAIDLIGNDVALRTDRETVTADAIVLAAGVDSALLLAQLGIQIPLYPVRGYSATASIKDFDEAPRSALLDEFYKVAVTRMGGRVRIAGTIELGSRITELHKIALKTLLKVGVDWFPNAANYNTSTFWSGVRPMLPDGPPLLGQTPLRNVYINIGHGANGWAMAAGSGKILADIISGYAPEIDMEGLTLSRYSTFNDIAR